MLSLLVIMKVTRITSGNSVISPCSLVVILVVRYSLKCYVRLSCGDI